MNNPENNKKANTVCWLDVVIFEDNTFAVEIYYVDIVKEFREQFNKHTFTTIEELDNFFGDTDVIYDCDSYSEYITAKYNKRRREVRIKTQKRIHNRCHKRTRD